MSFWSLQKKKKTELVKWRKFADLFISDAIINWATWTNLLDKKLLLFVLGLNNENSRSMKEGYLYF